ncbi:MAG: ATP-dependent Clp protease ATP-binding subunit [Lachnospiraceae bacterium]|nr:ATP-dependent Clp protease ATP-binding subunit [Lachnospiraceae bacterium]
MDNQYTDSANIAIREAQSFAWSHGQVSIGTEHLLIGLLIEKRGVARRILEENGVELAVMLRLTDQTIKGDGGIVTRSKGSYTPRAERVLNNAIKEADLYGQEQAGTEHILLAIMKEKDCIGLRLLSSISANLQKIYVDTLTVLGVEPMKAKKEYSMMHGGREKNTSKTPILDRYTRDLTAVASAGKLDPVIGRESEIKRMIQILSRRNKNNPCLLGEPGVGKTAIVEGLAQYIVDGACPASIKDKRVLALDLTAMVAGTKYRGEFEERIKKLLEELTKSADVLLFIDEIHTIIGAGNAEGAMDASNILKPSLARGEIQVIGATTTNEYRKHIEKDAALERRFQPVEVVEPDDEQTLEIIRGLRPYYESFHHVKISDEAIESAVKLSSRYINDRFMPDKAIDVIDEAAAKKKIGDLDDDKEVIVIRREIELLSEQKENALLSGNLKQMKHFQNKQENARQKLNKILNDRKKKVISSGIIVEEADVRGVVSMITKVPLKRMEADEMNELLHLEDELHKRVVGQNEAVTAVAHAVKRGRVGMKEPNHPIGTFLFLGPTGVGKTELCKALAETVYGDEKNIIRVDMSEYMESYSVSKMIGSPPGYVGHDDGGQLSEKVRRHPYSVVLFDEIEKAHPDVFNILLQVLDEGHITDSKGRRVSFKNTIIIMTSNCGAKNIVAPKNLGFAASSSKTVEHDKMKEAVMEEVKRLFKPEFLNRIDEMIVFEMLNKDNLKDIAALMVSRVTKRAKEQLDIDMRCDYHAIEYLLEKGTDEIYGARPLRRAIQSELEDKFSEEVLKGAIKKGDSVLVTTRKKELIFKVK